MSKSDDKKAPADGIYGVGDLLCWFENPETRRELEEFRIKYEKEHGPTDLTKRYTSLWPEKTQHWLQEHEPVLYWKGLPPFVQAFMKKDIQAAKRDGMLESVPNTYLVKLFLNKQMTLDGDPPPWNR